MPKYFNLLPEVISAQAKAREAEQALAQVDPKTEEDQIENEKPLTDRPLPEENARRVAIAQKILFPVLKAAGIEVPVGMDIFQNDQTLIAWLTQDVFVAGEQKDPVQMMILAFIHEVYGLPEMKLREGVTFAAMKPIEVVRKNVPTVALDVKGNDQAKADRAAVTLKSTDKQLGVNLNLNGFLGTLIDLFDTRIDVTKAELERLQTQIREEVVKAVQQRTLARTTVFVAYKDRHAVEANQAQEPLAYLEAYNAYVLAQDKYLKIFGHYVDEGVLRAMTVADLRALVAKDYETIRAAISDKIKTLQARYKLSEETISFLSSVFINAGLGYNQNGLSLNFVIGLTIFDQSRGVRQLITELRNEQQILARQEQIVEFERYSRDFYSRYEDVSRDMNARASDLSLSLIYGVQAEAVKSVDYDKFLRQLNAIEPKTKAAVAPRAAGPEISRTKKGIDVTKRAELERMMDRFTRETGLDVDYRPLRPGMGFEEILRIAQQNRGILSETKFNAFIAEQLMPFDWAKVEGSRGYRSRLAEFLARHTAMDLAQIHAWAFQGMEDNVRKSLEDKMVSLRLNYLDKTIQALMAREGKLRLAMSKKADAAKQEAMTQERTAVTDRIQGLDQQLDAMRTEAAGKDVKTSAERRLAVEAIYNQT
ncbi:MAG: hypothetical protein AAB356_00495, partial [Deltaproteobacteria bacterium]